MTSTNPYAENWAHFVEQTKDHRLSVERDVGLDRRLRIGAPSTGMWSWRVITWPGYLATYGDIADGYMFSRITDMIAFFRATSRYADGCPMIDLRYWAEKIQGPARNSVRRYSKNAFLRWVNESLDDNAGMGTSAIEDTMRELEDAADDAERAESQRELNRIQTERDEIIESAKNVEEHTDAVMEWLYDSDYVETLGDPTDADLTDWDIHFLYTCWAIDLTVRLWDEHVKDRGSNDGFTIIEGGLVQNEPGIEVFDLDVLDSDVPEDLSDEQVVPEVLDLFRRMDTHPNRAAVQPWLDRVVKWLRRNDANAYNLHLIDETLERRSRYE